MHGDKIHVAFTMLSDQEGDEEGDEEEDEEEEEEEVAREKNRLRRKGTKKILIGIPFIGGPAGFFFFTPWECFPAARGDVPKEVKEPI
eukprot:jgi/Bigna1/147654/aug1.302_g22362